MALSSGDRLGIYEIVEPIGAGGMGEVYRARDTELGRDVAVKVLPDGVASDAQRLARFRREAQVLASLNHPNIAAIYGTEQNALILELVEGPTLAERITTGPLPLDEAIEIARQVSVALEAAHEAGIVHRDLKPANIKVQEDGTVKVLDFGLAKAIEDEAEGDASESPTMTAAATRAGVILGTAAYMAPEQARGRRVDRRADIWALGVVLYEMLTGQRPFVGEDISLTLAEVMKSEPDWSALPKTLAPTLRVYLRRCLEKDPKRRLRDIGDLRLALGGAFDVAAEPGFSPSSVSIRRRMAWLLAVAAFVVGATAAVVTTRVLSSPASPTVVRSTISAPSKPPFLNLIDADVAVTPDGSRIVYLSSSDSGRRLVVRPVNELEASSLIDDDTVRSPFVSPDGEWIGFFTGESLQKVSIRGGPPIVLCDIRGGARGASWGDDGTIVFATNDSRGLLRVSATASGAEPEELTFPGPEESDHLWPAMLPGGKHVLFTIRGTSGATENSIALLSLDDKSVKVLLREGRSPRYAPSGHIVYASQRSLLAVPFDLETLEATGDPIPLGLDGVAAQVAGAADFAIAGNGSFVYVDGQSRGAERTLVWVHRDGSEEPIDSAALSYQYARLSPDGTRVALDVCCDEDNGIWIWDFRRSAMTRLTVDSYRTYVPEWTPDGSKVVFASSRAGVVNLFWRSADGTGEVTRLTESPRRQITASVVPDGKTILYMEESPETRRDLFMTPMDGEGASEPLLATEFQEDSGVVSPDGHWIAYRSNESGVYDVWVRPFPNVEDGQWQISRSGGSRPRWSQAAAELFYTSPSGHVMSVRYDTDADGFRAEDPQQVLEQTFLLDGPFGTVYDVHPDGERFLRIKEGAPQDGAAPPRVILVQNWTSELAAR